MMSMLFHVNKWYFMKTVTSNIRLISSLQIKPYWKKKKEKINTFFSIRLCLYPLYRVIPELWGQFLRKSTYPKVSSSKAIWGRYISCCCCVSIESIYIGQQCTHNCWNTRAHVFRRETGKVPEIQTNQQLLKMAGSLLLLPL